MGETLDGIMLPTRFRLYAFSLGRPSPSLGLLAGQIPTCIFIALEPFTKTFRLTRQAELPIFRTA